MGTRVFVGGLSYRVRERDLERFFRKYGNVRDISMKNGYAFVEFDDYRDADDAVYELNGKDLMGERVIVEHARGTDRSRRSRDRIGGGGGGGGFGGRRRFESDRGRNNDRYGPPTRTDYRVIVENLSSRVSWQDLKDYMRQAGEVTYADAHKNHRNEGVVEFMSSADMKAAIEKLDGAELNGRKIKLVEDKSRRRRGSRSSSGSRSRSRSRSGGRRSRSRRSSRSRSRSKSASRSKSRSRSKTKADRKSRSKSPAKKQSRSRSKSPAQNGGGSKGRSASRSRSRSRSRSPIKDRSKSRSRSTSKDKD